MTSPGFSRFDRFRSLGCAIFARLPSVRAPRIAHPPPLPPRSTARMPCTLHLPRPVLLQPPETPPPLRTPRPRGSPTAAHAKAKRLADARAARKKAQEDALARDAAAEEEAAAAQRERDTVNARIR